MLGKKIREQREKAGLTQEELAEKIGYDRSTLAKWENGTKEPLAITLKVVAEVLDVGIEVFYQ